MADLVFEVLKAKIEGKLNSSSPCLLETLCMLVFLFVFLQTLKQKITKINIKFKKLLVGPCPPWEIIGGAQAPVAHLLATGLILID